MDSQGLHRKSLDPENNSLPAHEDEDGATDMLDEMKDHSRMEDYDVHKEIKDQLNQGLNAIKRHLAYRKDKYKTELKKRIEAIQKDEAELKNISSEKYTKKWRFLQRKVSFVSIVFNSLRNIRNFGVVPMKMSKLRMTSNSERSTFLGIHWVVYPEMLLYKLHILMMLLIMVYLIIFFPLDLAFNLDNTDPILATIDTSISIYFGIDILVSFLTAYEQDGVVVVSNKKIARNYLLKWFIVDLITVIPLDMIFQLENFRYKRLLKVPRLMRLLNSIFQNTESKKKTRSLVMEKLKLVFSSSKTRMLLSILTMIMVFIHVTACLWLFIGLGALESGDSNNWIEA
jgi:Ion transport protein